LTINQEKALIAKLRSYRWRKHEVEGVPHYQIFYDSTMDDIIKKLPTTIDELRAVKNFGK